MNKFIPLLIFLLLAPPGCVTLKDPVRKTSSMIVLTVFVNNNTIPDDVYIAKISSEGKTLRRIKQSIVSDNYINKGYLKKAVYDKYQYFYYPNLEPGIYRILEAEYTFKILHTNEVIAPLPGVHGGPLGLRMEKQLVNIEFEEPIAESSKVNLSDNCVAFMGEFHVYFVNEVIDEYNQRKEMCDVVLKTKKEERRALNDLRLKYPKSKWIHFIK